MTLKDLIEMVKDYGKKDNKTLIYVVSAIVALIVIYFVFRNGNYFGGSKTITEQLNQVGTTQQQLTERIEGVENSVGSIEKAVDGAEQSANRIESNLTNAGEIIADCQRILRGVQERDESKKQ